jgi:predicted nucleic acid-binding protein
MIDTNVIIDHLLDQKPFSDNADKIIKLSEDGRITGMINTSSVTDIYYILRKVIGHSRSIEALRALFVILDVIDVSKSDLVMAMEANMTEYEDALVSSCAKRAKAEYIVTRNIKDFLPSAIPPLTPDDFLKRFFS